MESKVKGKSAAWQQQFLQHWQCGKKLSLRVEIIESSAATPVKGKTLCSSGVQTAAAWHQHSSNKQVCMLTSKPALFFVVGF
jgi:hypothetical protein